MFYGTNRIQPTVKTGIFTAILLFSLQAAISAPLFYVEKVLDAQKLTVTVTGSQLPEIKNVIFTCTYAIPKAVLMEAVISSPLPGTALSVLVDSSASALSATVKATSTITPIDNAGIMVLKIPAASSVKATDFAVTKAVIVDKKGTSTEITVVNKSTGIALLPPIVHPWQKSVGTVAVYRLDGRKMPVILRQQPCGAGIRRDGARIASFVSVH